MDENLLRELHEQGQYAEVTTRLIRELGPDILGFVRARMRDPVVAEDTYAVFCADVWRGMPGFRRQCPFEAWAYVLARNAVKRGLSRVVRPRRNEVGLSQLSAFPELEGLVRSTMTSWSDERTALANLRESLDEDELLLLVLRVDRKLPWKDVAVVFSDEGSDEAQLSQCAARLRKRFQTLAKKIKDLAEKEGLRN